MPGYLIIHQSLIFVPLSIFQVLRRNFSKEYLFDIKNLCIITLYKKISDGAFLFENIQSKNKLELK